MTKTHVLTFLSDSERQLIVALLEERLGTLSAHWVALTTREK
jgi:hypothetical protein